MDADLELLQAWRSGDRAAAQRLFDRHVDALVRFLATKVDGELDELIQRTFAAAVEKRDGYRGDGSFRAFLFGIARLELLTHLRAVRAARRRDAGEHSSIADLATSPSSIVARDQRHGRLLRALRALPLDYQIALELFYWEGMRGPGIARVLQVAEGTVRSRLRRARGMLRARLERDKGDGDGRDRDALEQWAGELRERVAPHVDSPELNATTGMTRSTIACGG